MKFHTRLCQLALISLAVIALGSCTTTSESGEKPPADSTPAPGQSPAIGISPDSEYAVINFIRPSIMGFAVVFGVWDGDYGVGLLSAMHNIQYKARPGEHLFMVRSENWAVLKANVEAGKTYTIAAEPRMGMMRAQVHLEVIKPNDKRLNKWLSEMKLSSASESDRLNFEKKGQAAAQKAVQNIKDEKAQFKIMNPEDGR